MKILTSNSGVSVSVYSTPKEMPIARYNEFQKYMLIASGIGNTMEDIDAHYARTISFIQNEEYPNAVKEMENNRHALISISAGINYPALAFACMVFRIGNEDCRDITEDGIERTLAAIAELDFSQEQIETSTEELKKKSLTN